MNVHKKIISDEEVQIIQLLNDLKLLECTLVQKVENNVLVEKEGKHISRTHWDIIKMYNEIIAPFHNIKMDRFSPGFYCHLSLTQGTEENDYKVYLLNGLKKTIGYTIDKKDSNEVKYKIFRLIEKTIKGLIEDDFEINQFNLLHGDFYNGNVMLIDGKYSLIDFEYVRFGPSQLEWAFLLFWDLIVENNREKREKFFCKVCSDLKTLMTNHILSNEDLKLIIELYLPSIVCLSLNSCDKSAFIDKNIVREGLMRFWNKEYSIIKGDIYGRY